MKSEWSPDRMAGIGTAVWQASAMAVPAMPPSVTLASLSSSMESHEARRSAPGRIRQAPPPLPGRRLIEGPGPTRIERVYFRSDPKHHYEFVNPLLKLHIEEDGSHVVVSDLFSTVYGVGETMEAAVRDYAESLFEYMSKLEARQKHLAKGLRRELAQLQQRLIPKA